MNVLNCIGVDIKRVGGVSASVHVVPSGSASVRMVPIGTATVALVCSVSLSPNGFYLADKFGRRFLVEGMKYIIVRKQ